jgi:AGCS family alanine or glycine:cation symporter
MFQAWNVGEITQAYFGIPSVYCGIILAILVGTVIIGGIKRIGAVAGRLVPIMVALYLLAGTYVLFINSDQILGMLALIFKSAFSAHEASGAFVGGTMGYAFIYGMKRALFSNEAGQGSSPIAHSAAKTDEPVREGIVAGLEPFIDTLVVCTFSALVILSTGVWNRGMEANYDVPPEVVPVGLGEWSLETMAIPPRVDGEWVEGELVFTIIQAHANLASGNNLHRLNGTIIEENGVLVVDWKSVTTQTKPVLNENGVYGSYVGATLTAKAFDSVTPGLGKWLITLAVWLFAISTIISWSYYGEQGIVYLMGERAVLGYKLVYLMLIIVATMGFIRTDVELDNLTSLGTGVMLLANVPIIWIFGRQAMRAYHDYVDRLKTGRMGPGHAPPPLDEVISGRDVD